MLSADRFHSTVRHRAAPLLRLFHVAATDQRAAILRVGLAPGDVTILPGVALSAVWLTDDARCAAPGALDVTDAERAVLGFDPGAATRTDGPLVLRVRIPAGDRHLLPWACWAPRTLGTLPAVLARLGLLRPRSWFLYRGAIPAAWITPVAATPPAGDRAFPFSTAATAAALA